MVCLQYIKTGENFCIRLDDDTFVCHDTVTKDGIKEKVQKIQFLRFFLEHSGQNPTNSRLCPIISKTVAS